MRLSEEYKTVIRTALHKHFGTNSRFFLFGSRVNDEKRGGDIDLYTETDLDSKKIEELKSRAYIEIIQKLGEQKIDFVIYSL